MEYNESPLFLLLDPLSSADKRELPIVVYETELKVIKDEPTLRYRKIYYYYCISTLLRILIHDRCYISTPY
jgi:hypothetical protein